MNFAVIYEKTSTGYSACVPDLPGCIAAGASFEETAQLIRGAIEIHLENRPVPKCAALPGRAEQGASYDGQTAVRLVPVIHIARSSIPAASERVQDLEAGPVKVQAKDGSGTETRTVLRGRAIKHAVDESEGAMWVGSFGVIDGK